MTVVLARPVARTISDTEIAGWVSVSSPRMSMAR
jgi:hypothetical protein